MSRICLCGLIGKSIDYTKSPSIHSYWYSKYEIKCYYIPINVSEKNVLNTIKTLSNVNFVGVNITIPYKNTVFSLCSDVDDRAAQLEAVNTLVFEKNGKITGYNTDIYGFQKGLSIFLKEGNKVQNTIVVLGSGGACKAVIYALVDMGFKDIIILNRTISKAQVLAKQNKNVPKVQDWALRGYQVEKADLVINTTSLKIDEELLGTEIKNMNTGCNIFDLNYFNLDAKISHEFRKKEISYENGFSMLFYQAQQSFFHWFGIEPTVSDGLYKKVCHQI